MLFWDAHPDIPALVTPSTPASHLQGDALLFWDAHPDGRTPDRHTLHAALPTVKGQKWTATRWIHSRAYDPNYDNS